MNDTNDSRLIRETHDTVISLDSHCRERCRTTDEKFGHIFNRLDSHDKEIKGGNGTRGLKPRVHQIEWTGKAAVAILSFMIAAVAAFGGFVIYAVSLTIDKG